LQSDREIYIFDDDHDDIEFPVNEQLHIINDFVHFLNNLYSYVNLEEVTQLFICWNRESEYDESLYLTSKINLDYPDIEVFVCIFDEELKDLVEKYNAKTFSTSKRAFKMLHKVVSIDSAIVNKAVK